jgi:hypothetical protein
MEFFDSAGEIGRLIIVDLLMFICLADRFLRSGHLVLGFLFHDHRHGRRGLGTLRRPFASLSRMHGLVPSPYGVLMSAAACGVLRRGADADDCQGNRAYLGAEVGLFTGSLET